MGKIIKKLICKFKGHESSGFYNLRTGKKWCVRCGKREELRI